MGWLPYGCVDFSCWRDDFDVFFSLDDLLTDDDDFVPAKEESLLRKEGMLCACVCVV